MNGQLISKSSLFWLLLLLALQPVAPASADPEDEDEIKAFLQGIGEAVYAFAWPTATYEGFRFDGTRNNPTGGTDVVFVVHGLSAFSGGSLRTEVILTLDDGAVTNLRWGRHNAILSPPGKTAERLGEILVDLTHEFNRSLGDAPPRLVPSSSSLVQSWTLTDGCADGVGTHFRVFDLTGGKIRLIWPNAQEVYVLPPGEARTVRLQVSQGSKLCYGAKSASGGTGSYWGVGIDGKEGCKSCCRSADVSQITFTLSCD